MIDVTVARDPADNPGEDIINPMILTEGMAIQRGRKEIDANSKIAVVSLDAIYRSGLKPGHTVQVLDALQGCAVGEFR